MLDVREIGGIFLTGTVFKRIGAYILDILIVSMITTVLANFSFLNPNKDAYSEKYNELVNVYEQYEESEISEQEYNEAAIPISYELYRLNIPTVLVDIVCILLYFGVLPYFMKGQTIGKKLFQIRIVSANDKPVSLVQYLLRATVLGNVLISIASILIITLMNADNFYIVYENVNLVGYIIMYITLFMVLIRKDNRGLHDFVANTKVVLTEEEMKERLAKIEEEQAVLEKELEVKPKTKEKTVTAKTTKVKKKNNKKTGA